MRSIERKMKGSKRRLRKGRQLALFNRNGWGGKRKGAGRKPLVPRKPGQGPGVTHVKRPELASHYPVHVTIKVVEGLPSLRSSTGCGSFATAGTGSFDDSQVFA